MAIYMPEEDIKVAAQDVLDSFENKYGKIMDSVPVDEIIERHLGYHFEVFDNDILPDVFNDEVLGYIDLRGNTIGIHESLLPECGGSIGRYKFTLAHEGGHGVMHKPQILASAAQYSCFEQREQRYLAKTENATNSLEWQADSFSGHLIMPDGLVLALWKEFTGSYKPRSHDFICRTFTPPNRRKFTIDAMIGMHIKPIATKLEVSAQALGIRLKNMGLITEHEQYDIGF